MEDATREQIMDAIAEAGPEDPQGILLAAAPFDSSDGSPFGGKELAAKWIKVLAGVERIPKNGWNDKHKYKYLMAADVVDQLRQIISTVGLAYRCETVDRPVRLSRTDSYGKEPNDMVEMGLRFTFMDPDTAQWFRSETFWGWAQDSLDKAPYKAYTGAEKYALMLLFGLASDDDPEKDHGDTREEDPAERDARIAAKEKSNKASADRAGKRKISAKQKGLLIGKAKEAGWDGAELLAWVRLEVKRPDATLEPEKDTGISQPEASRLIEAFIEGKAEKPSGAPSGNPAPTPQAEPETPPPAASEGEPSESSGNASQRFLEITTVAVANKNGKDIQTWLAACGGNPLTLTEAQLATAGRIANGDPIDPNTGNAVF
jgi:hypothetical protein